MEKITRRGYVKEDEKQFSGVQLEHLKEAAKDTGYLLDRGYAIKPATTFIGNHYMFSERQRLALARSVSSKEDVKKRREKQITRGTQKMSVHIDGFNTIITLEVALSGSLLLQCCDGTIRDLAGLRGTYRVIDKTKQAVYLILNRLQELAIGEATFYLDTPVSNSGRLKMLILQLASEYDFHVSVEVIHDVDRVLERLPGVITGDAIILNKCKSWINLVPDIISTIPDCWLVSLVDK